MTRRAALVKPLTRIRAVVAHWFATTRDTLLTLRVTDRAPNSSRFECQLRGADAHLVRSDAKRADPNSIATRAIDTSNRRATRTRVITAANEDADSNNGQTVASSMWELHESLGAAGVAASGVTPVLSIGVMKSRAWEYYAREVAAGLEDYYAGAGEAPGVWTGRGVEAAGIAGEASGESLERAFGGACHPVSGDALGRPWREPDGVIGYDATFSAPKSVSVLFAIGGPEQRAQIRAAHVAAVEDAGLAYLEDHAALTRRGHNGVMVTDTEGLVVARFEHRTSRALDPQLHSHCLILNKVRDAHDGSWRALHGHAVFEEAKTAGVLYQAGLRAELTRRLGLAWGPVSEHGQAELAGMPRDLLARFSTRTAEIEGAADAKVAELEHALGRPLEAGERGRIYRLAVLATRAPKDRKGVDDRSLYARWAAEVQDFGVDLAALVREILEWAQRAPRPAPLESQRRATVVATELTAERATFTRREVVQAIARRLDAADARTLREGAEELADVVLADPEVVCLHAPARVEMPAVLRRRDGWSVWDAPQAIRYTTRQMLEVEGRILHNAQLGRAPIGPAGVVDAETLERAAAAEARPLGTDQHDALRAVMGRGRRIEVVVGPAGVGKTAMVRVAARAWQASGYHVIGLAHTAVAADVLRTEAEVGAETVAKFLDWHTHGDVPAGWRLTPRHVLVVDEAGMLATRDLDRLRSLVEWRGAKLVLVGDDRQLGAVRAPGGMFAALAQELGAVELRETHRFEHLWEAKALTELRRGNGLGLDAFVAHGRVHGGAETSARNDCFARWWRAHQAGRDAVILAQDHATANQLANHAHVTRVVAGAVQPGGLRVRTETGSQVIGVGDVIETRRNDRRLTYGAAPDQWLRNHDRWHVVAIDPRRSTLDVEHVRHHARVRLPADYVAHHVRLGYASTIASAQGLTVDEAHVVVSPGMYASELYTALSRGRHANHAYAICDPAGEPQMHAPTEAPSTPAQVLARVAHRERPDWAAHSVLRRALTHPEHLDVLRDRKREVVQARMHMPDGPERDALDAYSQQLSAQMREQLHEPTPAITRHPALTRPLGPEPRGLGIDL
jgi:conjugative relaxase-like TrwC/TraI family protein